MSYKLWSISLATVALTFIRILRGLGNLVVYPFIVAEFGYEILGVFIVFYSIASGVGRLLTLGFSQIGFRDISINQNKGISKLYTFRVIVSLISIIIIASILIIFKPIATSLIFVLPVVLLSLSDGSEWVANNQGKIERLAMIKGGVFCIFLVFKTLSIFNFSNINWFHFTVGLEALCLRLFLIFLPMKMQIFSLHEIHLILRTRIMLFCNNIFVMFRARLDTWLVSLLYGAAIAGYMICDRFCIVH